MKKLPQEFKARMQTLLIDEFADYEKTLEEKRLEQEENTFKEAEVRSYYKGDN